MFAPIHSGPPEVKAGIYAISSADAVWWVPTPAALLAGGSPRRQDDAGAGWSTQEDPIGLAGGLNLYGYAGGDPINYHDPFGLCKGPKGEDLPPEQCKENLTGAQNAAMANPKYQPVANGPTFCNQATLSVVLAMNGSTSGLVDANGNALRAAAMVSNLASSRNYRAVSAQDATSLANQGELVIAAGPGHVATLRPESAVGDATTLLGRGPLHADVGRTVGVYRFTQAWGKAKQPSVVFYTPVNP